MGSPTFDDNDPASAIRGDSRESVVPAETQRTRQALQYEKTILEMVALDRPVEEILREVCLGVERLFGQNVRCSILTLRADGNTINVAAAPSLPQAYSAAIDGLMIGPGVGSCGTSIYCNKQVIVSDIEHDPLWADYRALALSFGLRACWSTPIADSSGSAVGAFGVYSDQPCVPQAEDLAFIADITHLVGIALRKDAVERSLQESEERYRSVVNSLTEGIVVQSRDGVALACNPSAERILRFAPGKLLGMRRGSGLFKRVLGENGAELKPHEFPTAKVLRSGEALLGQIVGIEMHEGAPIWISQNVLPIRKPGEAEPGAVLISFTDISAVREAQERLRFLANHDSLTGLANRAFLNERLTHALALAQRRQHQVALLFLDLDRFKNVNDTVGHEAGDRLLQIVAARLAACSRDSDTLARLGGDEFVILAEGFGNATFLSNLSQRILKSIAEPFQIDDNEYYVGVSIGISVFPNDGQDGPTLLRCADSAMYLAKERGRNNYQFFTTELNARTQRRYLLEKNLRHALSQQEFRLHYQPKVDLSSGRIVGAEALLRWESPGTGLVPPNDFIPIAEETGLIIEIGNWVLEQACRQAAAWRRDRMPDLRMAVNLSARQFQHDGLAETIMGALQRSGLPASALDLEITESLLIGESEKLMPVFDLLTGIGARFSIDDFGTGYSSLSYLQRFPISELKIDRSFVNGIPGNRDSVALTQAIIAMAQALDMRVIAEGVEQRDQLEFLKQAGCHEMQGFYFSKPLTAEAFEQLLQGAERAS